MIESQQSGHDKEGRYESPVGKVTLRKRRLGMGASLVHRKIPAKFVGRAEAQVTAFLETYVRPVLAKWQDLLKEEQASRVKV